MKVLFITLNVVMVSVVAMLIYHFSKVIGNLRPGWQGIANIFPPLLLLAPGKLSDLGNLHRKRFVMFFVLFCLVLASIAAVKTYFSLGG